MNWITLLLGAIEPVVQLGATGGLPTTTQGWLSIALGTLMPMAAHLMTPPASSPVISPSVAAAVTASK